LTVYPGGGVTKDRQETTVVRAKEVYRVLSATKETTAWTGSPGPTALWVGPEPGVPRGSRARRACPGGWDLPAFPDHPVSKEFKACLVTTAKFMG